MDADDLAVVSADAIAPSVFVPEPARRVQPVQAARDLVLVAHGWTGGRDVAFGYREYARQMVTLVCRIERWYRDRECDPSTRCQHDKDTICGQHVPNPPRARRSIDQFPSGIEIGIGIDSGIDFGIDFGLCIARLRIRPGE